MARQKRSGKRGKNKGPIHKIWRLSKLLLLLVAFTAIGYGIWYSQQDEAKQRQAQEQIIDQLEWLVELDETNKDADEFLAWIIDQIPASRGVVVTAGDIEGADQYTFAGIPISTRPVKILKNAGYIVGYDEEMRNPAWVAYRLQSSKEAETIDRPHGFDVDPRTRARVEHHDYTNSGYDRGHMAPNYAIGMSHGAQAQLETFFMSNIVPQLPDLNRGPWKTLEQLIANEYLERNHELWVITGPIYNGKESKLQSGVPVPFAFFKILLDEIDGGLRTLAWVMPQSEPHAPDLQAYLVTIDQIEAATGLDFFSLMNDTAEETLEAAKTSRMW